MIDEDDNKTSNLPAPKKSDAAKRQAEFKRRQRAAGLRQVAVWINAEAWNLGFAAGEAGQPAIPISPDATDAWSWFGGWVEGNRKWEKLLQQKL